MTLALRVALVLEGVERARACVMADRAAAAAPGEMLPAAEPPLPLPLVLLVMAARALVVVVRAPLSMVALGPVLMHASAAEAEESREVATLEEVPVAVEVLKAVPPAPICMREV